jgi:hypothetical protein
MDRDHTLARYDTLEQAMPSNQPVAALDPHQKYENLSDLYLMLWSQLDALLGDGKWLDIVPPQPVEWKQAAKRALQELDTMGDWELRKVIGADYARVEEITLHPDAMPKPEIESFKDYLRDAALRYTEDADPL